VGKGQVVPEYSTIMMEAPKNQKEWVAMQPTLQKSTTTPAGGAGSAGSVSYLTSFQNAAFSRQAITVNRPRNKQNPDTDTHAVFWAGSAIHCR
jgi:hypothetical protein